MVRYDGLAEEGSGSFHPDPRERGEKRPTITIARPFYEAVNRPTRSRNAGGAHLPPPNLLAETFTLAHECGHFLSWRERAPRDEWTAYYIAAKARDDAWSQLPDDLPPPEYNERLRSSAKEQLTADQIDLILAEEARAWAIGRELLESLGFEDLPAYDERTIRGLHDHRYRLGLDELWDDDLRFD
ncbi:MAG: hypothetical protein HS104_16335 [Polyangiaceae bacterium]|nr:hypothetical protein [Polyangiaceae bacterium]